MGDKDFEFSAPQYIDNLENAAVNSERDSLDSYFNVPESLWKTPAKKSESPKDVFMTPLATPKCEANDRIIKSASRKSSKIGDLVLKDVTNLTRSLSLGVDVGTFEGIALHPQSAKKHQMRTRRDSEVEALALRSRQVKRKTLGGWEGGAVPADGKQLKRARYVSLAEALLNFEVATPPRFKKSILKAKELPQTNRPRGDIKPKLPTIPVTPNLETKKRVRIAEVHTEEPLSHIPKINPLNPKVFEKPKGFVRTEVHPPQKVFNFKPKSPKVKKDSTVKDEPTFTFKARPVPKSVLAPRPMMMKIPTNVKKNGDIVYEEIIVETRAPRVCAGLKIIKNKNSHLLPIKSSYERGKERLAQKKEQELKKTEEEAKKNITHFKAKPAPSFITSKNVTLNCSTVSSHSCKENKEDRFQFKARAAAVLHKKPFQPKKPEKVLLEVNEFHFSTERRLKERQEFENKIKEKEDTIGTGGKKLASRFSVMPKLQSH